MEYFSQIIKSQRAKKSLTALNLFGLSVCIGSALLILFYVRFELSFDTFHDGDRIYRVESRLYEGNVLTDNWATTTFGHAPVMFREIPGIEQYVRVTAQDREQARHAGGAVAGRRTLSADDSGRRIRDRRRSPFGETAHDDVLVAVVGDPARSRRKQKRRHRRQKHDGGAPEHRRTVPQSRSHSVPLSGGSPGHSRIPSSSSFSIATVHEMRKVHLSASNSGRTGSTPLLCPASAPS